jgi:hypothetical protein
MPLTTTVTVTSEATPASPLAPGQPARALVTVVGSFLGADLPGELDQFFRDGILVDRRNGTPMEMDAYSLYLALKAIEARSGADLSGHKRRLLDAVLARLRAKDGFWAHGAWTGKDNEVHMRFTAAAIRLLVEALGDKLLAAPEVIVAALKKHLSFSERLPSGVWFYHDSLEVPGLSDHYRDANRFHAWGGSKENCLVLNTHLDTIATVLHVLDHVEMSEQDRAWFIAQVNQGLAALGTVLDDKPSLLWAVLGPVDALVRMILFRTNLRFPKLGGKLHRVALKTYYRARLYLKRRWPRFALFDGYIERDIGLGGTAFEYHLVNIYDLARFLNQARISRFAVDASLLDRCGKLVDRGIDHAVRSAYRDCWRETLETNCRATLLCETILARLATLPAGPVSQHWISGYCEVRRRLPPTPALMGYDPLSLPSAFPAGSANTDAGAFSDRTPFVFDVQQDRLRILDSRSAA